MAVAERGPEKERCFNPACKGGVLTETKGGKYWKCGECNKLTCLGCKAMHEGENCGTYQSKRAQREKGTAVNKSAEASSSTEKANVVPFVPGKKYFCGALGCTYETVLHEGSCKFWCPWCYTRHEIEGDQLFRYKQIKQEI
ncbi:uncharacterized protein LOC144170793 [Haemaphysalis longicornis]